MSYATFDALNEATPWLATLETDSGGGAVVAIDLSAGAMTIEHQWSAIDPSSANFSAAAHVFVVATHIASVAPQAVDAVGRGYHRLVCTGYTSGSARVYCGRPSGR